MVKQFQPYLANNKAVLYSNYRDHKQTASDAKLRYVTDSTKGIVRKRNGKNFVYYFNNERVRDEDVLARIKKLVIPPAWKNVWICHKPNGHIQATGFDVKGRKQYRYHNEWSAIRNETKYYRLLEFGKAIPALRKAIEKDIRQTTLSKQKVLATVLTLMEQTCIRVGNSEYEKENGSYGLTTLKDGHVNISGTQIKFAFKGKKGIFHTITLKNKRLARIVKACRDIPGKELFQYIDEQGMRNTVDSGMVNNYIRDATGKDFSAKDLRTWAGSLSLLVALQSQSPPGTEAESKKNIQSALDEVCKKLGNTRTVCRKYYVHPCIIKLYEDDDLQPYFKQMETTVKDAQLGLTGQEKVLMKILSRS